MSQHATAIALAPSTPAPAGGAPRRPRARALSLGLDAAALAHGRIIVRLQLRQALPVLVGVALVVAAQHGGQRRGAAVAGGAACRSPLRLACRSPLRLACRSPLRLACSRDAKPRDKASTPSHSQPLARGQNSLAKPHARSRHHTASHRPAGGAASWRTHRSLTATGPPSQMRSKPPCLVGYLPGSRLPSTSTMSSMSCTRTAGRLKPLPRSPRAQNEGGGGRRARGGGGGGRAPAAPALERRSRCPSPVHCQQQQEQQGASRTHVQHAKLEGPVLLVAGAEAGAGVDLQQPGLERLVDEDVVAVQLQGAQQPPMRAGSNPSPPAMCGQCDLVTPLLHRHLRRAQAPEGIAGAGITPWQGWVAAG